MPTRGPDLGIEAAATGGEGASRNDAPRVGARHRSASHVELRGFGPEDAPWVVARHGALYGRDEGFDASFEALVARIVAEFQDRRDPARERAWIAWQGGARCGCIFCAAETADVAKLRLFLVEPELRGTGLGRRLLHACLSFAAGAGYRRMALWTHRSHAAACRLYAASGFAMTAERPATSFGQAVVEQRWERGLDPGTFDAGPGAAGGGLASSEAQR